MDIKQDAKQSRHRVETTTAQQQTPRLPKYEHRPRDWGDHSSYCPKCGFAGHMEHGLMRWWKPVYIAEHLASGMVGRPSECLLVKCKVCSYAWTEDVLEADSAPN